MTQGASGRGKSAGLSHFAPAVKAKKTVKVPAGAVAGSPYTLSTAEVKLLKKLALKNVTTTLHYRIRGSDAEKAFVTHSDAKIVKIP